MRMPRRNRNAARRSRMIDDAALDALLAGAWDDGVTAAARVLDLEAGSAALMAACPALTDGKFPCAGCRRRGHWNGDHCPACKVRIVLDARFRSTRR